MSQSKPSDEDLNDAMRAAMAELALTDPDAFRRLGEAISRARGGGAVSEGRADLYEGPSQKIPASELQKNSPGIGPSADPNPEPSPKISTESAEGGHGSPIQSARGNSQTAEELLDAAERSAREELATGRSPTRRREGSGLGGLPDLCPGELVVFAHGSRISRIDTDRGLVQFQYQHPGGGTGFGTLPWCLRRLEVLAARDDHSTREDYWDWEIRRRDSDAA